jgi:hypothetical protein
MTNLNDDGDDDDHHDDDDDDDDDDIDDDDAIIMHINFLICCVCRVGRHSKSLDTDRKVCGKCRGRFQLLSTGSRSASTTATPRTPNPFAMFVKENYSSVRRPGVPHKEVMDLLSKEFAKTKLQF